MKLNLGLTFCGPVRLLILNPLLSLKLAGGLIIVFSSFLALSSQAREETYQRESYHQYIETLQNSFENASPQHTLIYFDRLWMGRRFQEIKELYAEEKDYEAARIPVVQQYFKDVLGKDVDELLADHVADYFDTGMKVALRLENKTTGEKYCGIMPSTPVTTAKEEVERLLYWKHFKDLPEYRGLEVAEYLSKEQLTQLTDIHETFHCLDPFYIPKYETESRLSQETVHKAESYAEVAALLYLSQKGQQDLTETRALYRIVGSFMVGRHGHLIGPNSSPEISFGVVYSFFPAMFAAQDAIDRDQTRGLNLEGVQNLAFDIVEAKSFDSPQSLALRSYQKDPEALQNLIEQFRDDSSEHFRKRFRAVEKMRDHYVDILTWAFERLFRSSKSSDVSDHSG